MSAFAPELTEVNAARPGLVENDAMMGRFDIRVAFATILLLATALAARAEDDLESAFRGKRLAEANCGGCHAIAQYDDSTLGLAPPLREIGARFSAAALRDMLRGQVFLDHAIMPDFEPDEQQAADLATYILSISETRSEAHGKPAGGLHRM